jgi:hypothetical protein
MQITGMTMSGGFNFTEPSAGVPTSGLTLLLDAGNASSYSGSGNTWTDLSPSSKNGNIQANVSWVSNGASSYFNFNNDAADYVIVPEFTSLNSATTFSQSSWFQFSGNAGVGFGSQGAWFSWGQPGSFTGAFFGMLLGEVNPAIEINSGFGGTKPNTNPFGGSFSSTWYNCTVTYNGSAGSTNVDRVKVYVNGVNQTLANPTQTGIGSALPNFTTNANVYIGVPGYSTTEGKFIGNVAYTSVYDRALSSTEATNIFNALKSRYGY